MAFSPDAGGSVRVVRRFQMLVETLPRDHLFRRRLAGELEEVEKVWIACQTN